MRGHIHTDALHALFTLGVVIVGLHALRAGGAWLANNGMPGVGNTLGALATFNGG